MWIKYENVYLSNRNIYYPGFTVIGLWPEYDGPPPARSRGRKNIRTAGLMFTYNMDSFYSVSYKTSISMPLVCWYVSRILDQLLLFFNQHKTMRLFCFYYIVILMFNSYFYLVIHPAKGGEPITISFIIKPTTAIQSANQSRNYDCTAQVTLQALPTPPGDHVKKATHV